MAIIYYFKETSIFSGQAKQFLPNLNIISILIIRNIAMTYELLQVEREKAERQALGALPLQQRTIP